MSVSVQAVKGAGQHVIKRYVLHEGSNFSIPVNSTVVYSEVVVQGEDNTEILELWLAVPVDSVYTPPTELPDEELPEPPVNRLLHKRNLIDEDEYEFVDEVDDDVDFEAEDEDDGEEFYYDY